MSVTDPEARLYKKSPGSGASLCCIDQTLMENRNGPIVQTWMTQAASRQIAAQSPAGQWMVTPGVGPGVGPPAP